MLRVTVERIDGLGEPGIPPIKIFEQTVDDMDLPKVFAAINSKPRKPRVRKNVNGEQTAATR